MRKRQLVTVRPDARRTWLCVVSLALGGTVMACREPSPRVPSDTSSLNAYDTESDWNDPEHLIPLNYQEAQGKRVFYKDCVWCHADSTPAGPSNRSNVKPMPALMNDGATLNQMSDESLRNIIELGGAAVGKSPMMPPWKQTLSAEDLPAVIAFMRAIAQPPSRRP